MASIISIKPPIEVAKYIKNIPSKRTAIMNIKKTVEGIVILVLSALILADGVLGVMDIADTPLLTLPVFKLLVGFLALVLAGAYIEESRN